MSRIEQWTFGVLITVALIVATLALFLPAGEVTVRLPQWLASVRFPLWIGTILIFMIGGGVGGIVAHMQRLQDGPTLGQLSWSDEVTRGLVISATGGMGGAIAAMFIMILDSKISKQQTPTLDDYAILTFVSTAFVSGYLGFRFLKSVAERFELLNAAKVEAKKVAEERVDQFLERSRTIDEALRQYENASQEKDKLAAAQKLIEAHNRFKDDRHVAIKLARDYRLRNQLASAIAILDETIEAIRQTGQKDAVSQKNLADLLYNRACYNCLSADKETQDSRKHFFKEKAYKDLRESADLSPDNGPEAARDNDFRLIHAEAEFQSITGASPSIPSIQPITPAASPTSTPSRAKEQPSNAPKQSRSERTGAEETSQAEGKLKESEETN